MSENVSYTIDAVTVLNNIPGRHLVLLPDARGFTIVSATDECLDYLGLQRNQVSGKSVVEVLQFKIDEAGFDSLIDSINSVAAHFGGGNISNQNTQAQHLTTENIQTNHFNYTIKPVVSSSGDLQYLILSITDKTSSDRSTTQHPSQTINEKDKSLYNVIYQAPLALFIFRGENMIIDTANKIALEMIQRTEEVVGKPLLEAIPELSQSPAYKIFEEVYNTGIPQFGKELLVPLEYNGILENRYFNFAYSPLVEDGKVVGVIDVATEVTEQVVARQKVEAAQTETERQKRLYETVTSNTPDLIYVFDTGYRFTYANEALLSMWGKTAAESIGRSLLENGYEDWHATMHEREIDEVIATKKSIRGEVSFPHATLGKRIYDYIFVPVVNEQGEVEAIAGTTRDITDLKFAEEALKKSEQNLQTLIMQAPVAMCIMMGPDYVVSIANDLMIALWGKPKEDVMNRPVFEGLPDARQQGLEQMLACVYSTGEAQKAVEQPVELIRNGKLEKIYQDFVYEPYRDATGKILGIIAITIDVTEQVLARHQIEQLVTQRTKELAAANEALQQTNKELQRSNQNLEEFAHASSHDLKEPIRKIHFFTQQLKEQLSPYVKESELRSFGRIENATQRMGNLIDDLLLYSQVSQKPHETEPINLNLKLQRVLEDLELDIEEKKAKIEVGPLPVVQGYRRQLQQLFQNLISNALKYSKADVPPHIEVSATKVTEKGQAFYLISVRDNGIGFEQQYSQKIFQMFSRLHGKAEYSGTGVGLSIVQKVVENHHGFIRVHSAVNEGSTFFVYLPAVIETGG